MPQTRHYEMKDSGVEWIGELPSHWTTKRGKNILRLLSRPVRPDDEIVTCFRDGDVTLRKNRREEGFTNALVEAGYQGVEPGDLVVHGMDGFAGSIGVSDSRGKASPVLNVMDSSENKRYLMYYLRGIAMREVFLALSTGIRVRSCDLRWNKLAVLSYIVPPLSEQTAIAAYLDEKCATIDAIIAEAKSSIEEYKSWKASVIFETVTKGLNPNAEMKDSGVEWIGKMPKAWKYTPLKYLASCNDEVLTETTPEDYTFDYIDIGSVHTGNGIGICERMQFKDAPSRARRIVRDGDIIVSTVRTYLKAIAQVGNYDVPHIASTGFAVIRTKNANASFLRYALLSDNFVSQVEADSVGISYPAINASQIMAFKIPVPSIAEQVAIASYLDARCAAIDGIIAEKEALISDLETYKKSLIFEVVTGKRRVC